jgi:hypothetical protein
LILAAICILAGFQMILTGIVADLINANRSLMEDISYRCRRMEQAAMSYEQGAKSKEQGARSYEPGAESSKLEGQSSKP